ncbi:meiotic recombination protein rec12 [Podospora fimiseda]|uniref:DNA topoisomerase (ATP-hydrolyzing) n=1 Tax=Podospora fimiseda TaxID=252190 RepID=A0AAN7BJ91_9PEZI|nr:meiotic recombination protein rec12 [Podospora fimiseda]
MSWANQQTQILCYYYLYTCKIFFKKNIKNMSASSSTSHHSANFSTSSAATSFIPDARNIVSIPNNDANGGALAQIEDLLESIVDAIEAGSELIIPYRSSRTEVDPEQRDARHSELVRFPGRNIQEAKRFEALFRIIELSHEALLSGNIITKRNIYYQDPDLFKSQAVVDALVDNLAFTLGVGRGDLNIVAAAKGLISGPVELIMRDGSVHNCGLSGDGGVLLPSLEAIDKIAFYCVRWVLVIEKEATFRTLAASQYAKESQAGHGLLITAKGFPDLATRRFLSLLHSIRPELLLFGLVDFDPHGIAILRTYKYGSQRLEHEVGATIPGMKWLGIKSSDIMPSSGLSRNISALRRSDSQSTQEYSSQESQAYSYDGSQSERPPKRLRIRRVQDPSDSVAALTQNDRKKAMDILKDICSSENMDGDVPEQMLELQRMLMLNIKAEIQAVDNYGDLTDWLDERLCQGR